MNLGEQKARRQWVGLALTTALGVAATVAVGYYQLSRAVREAALAEQERSRNVKSNLVSIVEEHVLNDKPIDLPRLGRLVDQRRREERVGSPITLSEVLEQAEFNILNSRYLTFTRKQAMKPVFDSLYSELGTRAFAPFEPSTPNSDLFNELARKIQQGKTAEALQALKRVQEAHAKDVATIQRERPLSDTIAWMLRDPIFLGFMAIYSLFAFLFTYRRSEVFRLLRNLIGSRGRDDR